jgi:hypothetical protein
MPAKQLALNADNGNGFNPAQDRVTLGSVPGYTGGPATLSFSFDEDGVSLEFDAGPAGNYASGKRPWSQIPGGFDIANLGEQTQLFIQSFDTSGGTPASVIVNSISVTGTSLGDFNGDGSVDAADYVVWRGNLGSDYTDDDYQIWRANFGTILTAGTGSSTTGLSTPEAPTVTLVGVCWCFALLRKGKRFGSRESNSTGMLI